MNKAHQKQTPNGPSRTGSKRRAMPLSGKPNTGFTIGALAGCITPNVASALSWPYRFRFRLKSYRLPALSALLAFVVASAFAQSDADFAKANGEFAKGEFKEAIQGYESMVQSKQWSAPLFYNLGNA